MGTLSPQVSLEALRLRSLQGRTQLQVRLRIPKTCHGEPVISNLISRYGLQINIMAALLGSAGEEDGWFDLAMAGEAALLRQALIDLADLEADIWIGSQQEDYT
ncbi:MAG: ABC transporter [Cyanobacteria bacterium REEB459]|nr:ABC transporter [Cyanobacteria bacterium REEB459]